MCYGHTIFTGNGQKGARYLSLSQFCVHFPPISLITRLCCLTSRASLNPFFFKLKVFEVWGFGVWDFGLWVFGVFTSSLFDRRDSDKSEKTRDHDLEKINISLLFGSCLWTLREKSTDLNVFNSGSLSFRTPPAIVLSPPNYGKLDGKPRYFLCPLYDPNSEWHESSWLYTVSVKSWTILDCSWLDIHATRANSRLFRPEFCARTFAGSCLQNCMNVAKLHSVHKEINDNRDNNLS